jgi:hypothetical protein
MHPDAPAACHDIRKEDDCAVMRGIMAAGAIRE